MKWKKIKNEDTRKLTADHLLDEKTIESISTEALPPEAQSELEVARWLYTRRNSLVERPGYVAASRRRLVERIRQEPSTRTAKAVVWKHVLWGRQQRKAFLAVLLVLALFANTRSIRASANASFPGDVFYPVKLVEEEIQLGLAISDRGESRLYTQFAQRRLAETAALILEGRHTEIQRTMQNYTWQVEQAVISVQNVAHSDPLEAAQLAASLDERVFKQIEVLSWLRGAVSQESQAEIDRALQVTEQSRQNLAWLLP